jgi:catechol 2,3-dioxygenase-like lactoylglutathione lyase family enzyme
MKRLFAVAVGAALSGPALADPAPPAYSLMSMKISVSDFARSTAFYTKYFGMKEGALYNPAEKALDWAEPGQGSNIIMVHDETGKLKGPPTSWLMFRVPDARKIAAELTAAGFTGVEPVQEMPQYKTVIVMARDPDGNQIEIMQIGGTK